MERYDIEKDRWLQLQTQLYEGRYHASACMLENRYIYVFGGFKSTHFAKGVPLTRVNKKVEKTDNVQSNYIERYDTILDIDDEYAAKISKI